MKLWGLDKEDHLKNRRSLAFWSIIYSLVLWPNELLFLYFKFDLEISLIKALLLYVTTLAGTAIGGYLWAASKKDNMV